MYTNTAHFKKPIFSTFQLFTLQNRKQNTDDQKLGINRKQYTLIRHIENLNVPMLVYTRTRTSKFDLIGKQLIYFLGEQL